MRWDLTESSLVEVFAGRHRVYILSTLDSFPSLQCLVHLSYQILYYSILLINPTALYYFLISLLLLYSLPVQYNFKESKNEWLRLQV